MKPIHLYVKTHNKTGLKYFGKTTQDPFVYKGSGIYWRRHLNIHGDNISTEIIGSFTDESECKRVATEFSISNNITESCDWANLRDETLTGGFDHIHSKHLSRDYMKQRWKDESYRKKMTEMSNSQWSEENKKRAKEWMENYWTPERRNAKAKSMIGNTNGSNLKTNPPLRGRICVTNGINAKFVTPENLDSFLLENPSWKRGRHPNSNPHTPLDQSIPAS